MSGRPTHGFERNQRTSEPIDGTQGTANTKDTTTHHDESAHTAANSDESALPYLSPIVRTLFANYPGVQRVIAAEEAARSPPVHRAAPPAPAYNAAPIAMSASQAEYYRDISGTNSELSYIERLTSAMRNTSFAADARLGDEDGEALKFLRERSDVELHMGASQMLQKIRDAHAGVSLDFKFGCEEYPMFGDRFSRVVMVLLVSKAACRDVLQDLARSGAVIAMNPAHEYYSAIDGIAAAARVSARYRQEERTD